MPKKEIGEKSSQEETQRLLWETEWPGGVRIALVQGDITRERVDAVVNAANSRLMHGGGVAGAIVRRGGRIIQEESDRLAPVKVGDAVATGAGDLPAHAVIHAVGPRMGEGDEDRKLHDAVTNSLRLADDKGFASLSMPAISSGIFGYPKERCAQTLRAATRRFFDEHPDSSLREVRFCNFDDLTCSIFLEHFKNAECGGAA